MDGEWGYLAPAAAEIGGDGSFLVSSGTSLKGSDIHFGQHRRGPGSAVQKAIEDSTDPLGVAARRTEDHEFEFRVMPFIALETPEQVAWVASVWGNPTPRDISGDAWCPRSWTPNTPAFLTVQHATADLPADRLGEHGTLVSEARVRFWFAALRAISTEVLARKAVAAGLSAAVPLRRLGDERWAELRVPPDHRLRAQHLAELLNLGLLSWPPRVEVFTGLPDDNDAPVQVTGMTIERGVYEAVAGKLHRHLVSSELLKRCAGRCQGLFVRKQRRAHAKRSRVADAKYCSEECRRAAAYDRRRGRLP